MMHTAWLRHMIGLLACVVVALACQRVPAQDKPAPTVIVAEGEFFTPQDSGSGGDKDWKLTPQDHSYASHTYGGMWSMNGALIGAPPDSDGAVATRKITVPAAGAYRVWSKYQAPPYFHYQHKLEVIQGGKTVFSHVYGKLDAPRFWSFGSDMHPQIWWFWGIDHDAAESPKQMANLAAGEAELRLTSVKQPEPAGDRFIDFVVLTTEPSDTYRAYKPVGIGSPFMFEAIESSRLYMRFRNTSDKPATLTARTQGHLQPLYGGQSGEFPAKDQPVAPGQWSPWFNIASICRFAHDEGVWLELAGAAAGTSIDVQLARDAAGSDVVGDTKVPSGEAVVIPMDIAWNKQARVIPSREHAARVIELARTKWRTANGGKKPQKIAYYGRFIGEHKWVHDLKDALGYNTLLPDGYAKLERDGYHAHTHNAAEIEAYAKTLTPEQRAKMRILSFGDEIHIGEINYADPANVEKFRAWLKQRGYTKDDLGVDPAQATLSKDDPRLSWYSMLFNESVQFQNFTDMTKLAETLFHPEILTAANYSPHPAPQYYGPVFQWVDIFKVRGMSAFWAEDYVFSVPEPPQIFSWFMATARSAVKYHDLPMHVYVMPHAPGQVPANLNRGLHFAVGAGVLNIDNFWIAPAENFTENFISWGHTDSFRVIHEGIYDSAEVENVSIGGKPRPARIAIVLSKATDFNERRLPVDPKSDPFAAMCTNFPQGLWQQILCRKDQQFLYLALKHAQHGVELITEDDIVDGVKGKDILPNYDVIYFAGEWVETRAARKLDAWVKNGGVLYAAAGVGHLNQYNQPETALLSVLGLKSVTMQKSAYHLRPLMELPLIQPIDTVTLDSGEKIPAIAMKQVLTVADGSGAKVIGKWADGSAAVTVRDHGKGKAFAVGTLPGHAFYKTGLKPVPFARGGYKNLYNPTGFDPAATKLALLALSAKPDLAQEVVCSDPDVEAQVLDNATGTLVTLVNWANEPAKATKVRLKLPFKPSSTRLVSKQGPIDVTVADGFAEFTLDIAEAEYVLLSK